MASGESEQLDQARLQQRMQDGAAMAGRLAHAFDNVLTGILGFTELTMSQLTPGSLAHRYIAEALQAAQQGAQLTQQLHAFSRAGTVFPGSTVVPRLFAEEEARLRPALPANITLQVTAPADLPPAAIDTETLRQVLTRLLDNAREAMPSGGTLTLAARRIELSADACRGLLGKPAPGAQVELIVADSGEGLSPEARSRVLVEPFFTTRPRHQGLGLAVVFRTVLAHKGGLSIGPGGERGTVVRLLLPVAGAGIRDQ